jgi:hypothetical protein
MYYKSKKNYYYKTNEYNKLKRISKNDYKVGSSEVGGSKVGGYEVNNTNVGDIIYGIKNSDCWGCNICR